MKSVLAILGIGVVALAAYAYFTPPASTDQSAAVTLSQTPPPMFLTSSAFLNGGEIPEKYTCDVEAPPSPPLSFEEVPDGTVSLALIMDDPDVPTAVKPEGVFDHWVVYDIDPATSGIGEGDTVGTPGANGRAVNAYAGPCPPTQYEPTEHRYYFRLYALDTRLDLPPGAKKSEVLKEMDGHIMATAELMGRYDRAD